MPNAAQNILSALKRKKSYLYLAGALILAILAAASILIVSSKKFVPTPEPETAEKEEKPPEAPKEYKLMDFGASSDITTVSLNLDKAALQEFVNQHSFSLAPLMAATESASENLILNVHLTNKTNIEDRYLFEYRSVDDPSSTPYQAGGIRPQEDSLVLVVFVSDGILASEPKEELNKRINATLLRIILNLNFQDEPGTAEEKDEKIKSIIADFLARGDHLVEIE